jgi:hypothetical protein
MACDIAPIGEKDTFTLLLICGVEKKNCESCRYYDEVDMESYGGLTVWVCVPFLRNHILSDDKASAELLAMKIKGLVEVKDGDIVGVIR